MSSQARNLIADWRKCLNDYRAASKKIALSYVKLTDESIEEDKLRIIDIFGNISFQIILTNPK